MRNIKLCDKAVIWNVTFSSLQRLVSPGKLIVKNKMDIVDHVNEGVVNVGLCIHFL